MKISVDDKELFCLTDHHKQVIMNDLNEDEFELDMKRRLEWVLMHKYECCFARLKREWDKKLKDRVNTLPTNSVDYANLVFCQPDYKSFKQKHLEILEQEKLEKLKPNGLVLE